MSAPQSQAVARIDWNAPPREEGRLKILGRHALPSIVDALPASLAESAQRMIRCLATECALQPKLLECSARSLFGALVQVAQLGLEVGAATGQAYLVPYGQNAQLVIGYKGFITLAHRAGVKRFTARTIYDGDEYEIEYGLNQRLYHRPKLDTPGAKRVSIGYYAVVELANGGLDFEFMTREQIEEHRNRYSKGKRSDSPWETAFDEMAKKTCIRRLAKRVPLSVEWQRGAMLDERADDGTQQLGAGLKLPAVVADVPEEPETDSEGLPIFPAQESKA